ncbi:metalloprotease [Fusarium coicis]|nr:metalloprotease [Fusarium coicis]
MEASKADIRIDFQQGGGSSSRVGTDALSENNQEKRTMNLDINLRHSEGFIRRKVLHEFGCVLCCEHEHQSPLEDFEWNKDLIYEELSKPPNSWSRATIDHNVVKRLESSENSVSGGTKNNTRLSERDKKWIANTYPPWSSDIGQFSTLQVRPFDTFSSDPVQQDMAFEPSYLNRLKSHGPLTVGITPATGSNVYSAACSWLEASVNEPDIKVGLWDIASTWSSKGKPVGGKTSTSIKFDQRFKGRQAPIVVAWFTGLSLGKDSPWRVKTYVTDVSPFKFQLHVEAGPDTDLRDATVNWVGIPAGKEGITAGSFCTDDILGSENAGATDFAHAGFQSAPAMIMAISGIDFECGHNLRLRVSHSSLAKDGMVWYLDSWLDFVLNTATGVYVAVGGPNVDYEN